MLEKQTIFEMARNPEDTERLLAKLQVHKKRISAWLVSFCLTVGVGSLTLSGSVKTWSSLGLVTPGLPFGPV